MAALRALLDAKEWRTAAKFGSLGALEVFAQAASSLLTALSGVSCHPILPVAILQLKRTSRISEGGMHHSLHVAIGIGSAADMCHGDTMPPFDKIWICSSHY